MKTILIANPKGGCGKSTLATNLAGCFAWDGESVVLGDLDRQQSSSHWLALRPQNFPVIQSWSLPDREPSQPPKGASIAIMDSPAGLHGKRLDLALKVAERILVPVQPGFFDMQASEDFFRALAEEKNVRRGSVKVAVVEMRVKANTRTANDLAQFLAQFELPVVARLSESQLYPQLQPRGLALFDLPRPRYERYFAEWQPLVEWLR